MNVAIHISTMTLDLSYLNLHISPRRRVELHSHRLTVCFAIDFARRTAVIDRQDSLINTCCGLDMERVHTFSSSTSILGDRSSLSYSG